MIELKPAQYKVKAFDEITRSLVRTFSWECPVCGKKYESEDDEFKLDFIQRLIEEEGVRFVILHEMQGTMCPDCYNDAEIQHSSL